MLFQTLGQAQIFLLMTCVGAGLSVLYDGLCLARGAFGGQGHVLADTVYALCALTLVFVCLERVQMEGLRAYVILGASAGWFLYAATVSRFLRALGRRLRAYAARRHPYP